MKNLIEWWRQRPTQEKWMIALVAILLICIAVRWAWIKSEASDAWRERFTAPAEQTFRTRADE